MQTWLQKTPQKKWGGKEKPGYKIITLIRTKNMDISTSIFTGPDFFLYKGHQAQLSMILNPSEDKNKSWTISSVHIGGLTSSFSGTFHQNVEEALGFHWLLAVFEIISNETQNICCTIWEGFNLVFTQCFQP